MRAQHDKPCEKADAFLEMIRQPQRGRLKVYLGYCAGVGKTFQMLQEGHRLVKDGVGVVVGLVETHGRAETARLIEGLEVVPPTRRKYRELMIEEMDVEAILGRKPEVALIDELAHTNIPGGRNLKRYEDVQDILAAGIHVITTLNVQHLESLYDTIESATGVKVRERLPDSVLSEADQIVNVDLTTEDLRLRLRDGKIYPAERVESAMANFFTPSNLEQLRETALRELTTRIDLRRREPDDVEAHPAPDQVMVCLSSRGPNSERLLRYASRLAGRLNRSWYALYVQTPSEDPAMIDARTHTALSSSLTLAKQLGAMVFTNKGSDVAVTIHDFAREYRVGHIVVGSPAHVPLWKRIFGVRSIVERLVDSADGMTVVVLCPKRKKATSATDSPESPYAQTPKPTTPPITLADMLSPDRIRIWDEPVLKIEALSVLAHAALRGEERDRIGEIIGKLHERELQSSTFFNEGVAFPHARIDGLNRSRMALGVTHHSVADVATDKPIELVFLILSPAKSAATQLQALSLASKATQNRRLRNKLGSAKTPEQAMMAIREWTETQNKDGKAERGRLAMLNVDQGE